MKKLFTLILAILCLLTMLSIPVFAADAGVEPYGTPGSGYDQKQFEFNGRPYTAYFYLQFDTSYRARSKCETEALVDVVHGTLTVQFKTGGSGYQTRTGGYISYSSSIDVATGVNYIGGKATFNKNIITSGTLGFLS